MAKKNGTSWFTAVKRVLLWSPSKDQNNKSIHRTRGEEYEHQKDTDRKREKRGWMFRKTKLETINSVTENVAGGTTPTAEIKEEEKPVVVTPAVDEETVIKLNASPGFIRRHWAAIIIQTAFRGYLARRALRALKGIVKLQALVRGNNVRNQAKLTLRCIKALVRVQDQVLHHQRSRVSSSTSILEARRNSMFAESNSFWDTKICLQDIRCRRSLSRDMSSCTNEWDDRLVNPEDTETILQRKLEVALKREKAQALAYSNQIRSRSYRNPSAGDETELVERTKWLDRWMATKQWDDTITNSTTCEQYKIKVPIKTLEIDTNISKITSTHQRFTTVSHSIPATPPSCKAARPVGLRSGSPRVPCSPSACPRSPLMQPNYMTATESAKARARPQSTPRRRPVGTVKKRLCYAEEERGYEYLRSPSFKSAYNGCLWGDHESDYSCCYGGRYAGEISPCSTSDLRWLK